MKEIMGIIDTEMKMGSIEVLIEQGDMMAEKAR